MDEKQSFSPHELGLNKPAHTKIVGRCVEWSAMWFEANLFDIFGGAGFSVFQNQSSWLYSNQFLGRKKIHIFAAIKRYCSGDKRAYHHKVFALLIL